MTMTLSQAGIDRIKRYESYSSVLYQDAAGNPTIGWGHLLTAEEDAAGIWKSGITPEAADKLLADDLMEAERAVNDNVLVAINQDQFDALVSFCFNVGAGHFLDSSALRFLNLGELAEVGPRLCRWDKVRNRTTGELVESPGLLARRREEAAAFASA